jgi:hypothetical protein
MNQKNKLRGLIWITIILLAWGITSCSGTASYPQSWIDYPGDGVSVPVGASVNVISHIFAREGVAEVVLSVNGEPYRRDVPSEAKPDFVSMQQEWIPAEAGTYILQVQGYDRQGQPGNPATVSVEVRGELPVPMITVTPVISVTPVITDTPTPVISVTPPLLANIVNFYSYPPDISAGSCATIYWKVENAQQVILGGIEQPFSGSYSACLCADAQYTLTVVNYDGTQERRTLNINVTGSCVTEPPAADTTPPPAPAPAVPANGLELACRSTQTLAWLPVTDSSGISGYYVKLEMQVKPGQWKSVGGYGPVTGKQVNVNVQCGDIYRWMVRAQDGAGNYSNWSAHSTFSINLN